MKGLEGYLDTVPVCPPRGIAPTPYWRNHHHPYIGRCYRVGLYWVEVVGYSAKSRNIRYRRITARGAPLAPVESMGRKRFDKEATPA